MNENEDDDQQIEEGEETNRTPLVKLNEDLEIINNCLYVIQEVLDLSGELYDRLNEDKIKTVSQSFAVIAAINKKIISDYKKTE